MLLYKFTITMIILSALIQAYVALVYHANNLTTISDRLMYLGNKAFVFGLIHLCTIASATSSILYYIWGL